MIPYLYYLKYSQCFVCSQKKNKTQINKLSNQLLAEKSKMLSIIFCYYQEYNFMLRCLYLLLLQCVCKSSETNKALNVELTRSQNQIKTLLDEAEQSKVSVLVLVMRCYSANNIFKIFDEYCK